MGFRVLVFSHSGHLGLWDWFDGQQPRGVSHTMALPFTYKKYLKAKEELWKLKIFHHAKNIIFKKSS
jgi:hypothetical protein